MKQAVIRTIAVTIALFIATILCTPSYSEENNPAVNLELTYPAGESPHVFIDGWVFGAHCIVNTGSGQQDISDSVQWSGTAEFRPAVGAISRPKFHAPGKNTIILTVTVDGQTIEKQFSVMAIITNKYASISDLSHCPADAHGCLACPHPTVGPIITGSPNVTIDNKPAARVGDRGIAAACCGPNMYTIAEGDPNVLIDGKPAARIDDKTAHCGGTGKIITGSGSGFFYPPYYTLFQCRMPGVKESSKPKRRDNESDDAWKRRKRAAYERLTYSDFQFEDMPVEKIPFIIHVAGNAWMIYPRNNFVKGSQWTVRLDSSFYDDEKGSGQLSGSLLLTVLDTYETKEGLLSAYPKLAEKKELTIIEFLENDGKTTLKDEKSSSIIGPIIPNWTAHDKREAVRLVKSALLWFDCFIAHVVYDYRQEDKINSFREFRDTVLQQTEAGSHLVRLYYEYGPYYAARLKDKPELAARIRLCCDLIAVGLDRVDTENTVVRSALDEAIYWVDRIASIYYTEGSSAGPGQFTRRLVPHLWEETDN